LKVLILTKKRLILFLSAVATSLIVLALTVSSSFPWALEKKIPIYRVERDEKIVSISFDAAWGNEQTQGLLDTLKKYDVKTTFFLVGIWADKYPESVKAIFDEGHDIGNHSDTHPHFPKLSYEDKKKEITECNQKIENITGVRPTLFRFPYGDYDNKSIEAVAETNMYSIQWNIDSLDWKNLNSYKMCKRIIPKLSPGSIILLHNGAKHTPDSLPEIIEKIQNSGYKIVPISQIIHKGDYEIAHDGAQIPIN